MQTANARKTPEEILKIFFAKRKSRNKGYSMRALARDLGKSPSYVSQVLSGQRRLSSDLYVKIADAFELDELARKSLSLSLVYNSSLPDAVKRDLETSLENSDGEGEYAKYEESHSVEFDILTNWYYIAILDLPSLSDFQPNVEWISQKIGISKVQTEIAVKRIFELGLLHDQGGIWKKTKFKLRFSTVSSKASVRIFHEQLMQKAMDELRHKINDQDFSKRLITGLTIATNSKNIERAKLRLHEMLFELSQILSEGECDELYHIGAQLFPLSKKIKK